MPPKIRRIETSSTKTSITAKAVVSRLKDGTIEYYYKLSTAEDSTYTKITNITDLGATVSTGITEGETYTVKAVAKNGNGESVLTKNIVARDKVLIESITFSKQTETTGVGRNKTLTVNILPENATNKTLKWTSEDGNIVTVNENGVITGVALRNNND